MLEHISFEGMHYWKVARSYMGRSLYTTGFYMVDDVLVDCGPPNARRILKRVFETIQPSRVLITHHHEDHTGNAAHLNRTMGCEVAGHSAGAAALQEIAANGVPFYRAVTWGTPDAVPYASPGEVVETSRRELMVFETPGHSDDHLCFFNRRQGWLFTGDLYLSGYLRYLRDDEDVYGIMASLRRMIELNPRVLLCNHRGPVTDGAAALARKLSYLEGLRDQVLDAFRKGMPDKDIAAGLLKKDLVFRWFSAGQFTSLNLIRAFLRESPAQ